MKSDVVRHRGGRKERIGLSGIIAGLVLATTLFLGAGQAANAETRTLKLYFLHTGERAEVAYKRNGRYLRDGLKKINHVLRDWRQNEPTQMNPLLLDLLWAVYQESGSRDYFHVVSAYRSPKTNAMLRKTSNGVAKTSQHMSGNAIDFFLPDVKLSKLRAIALKKQVGGVGYYPRSGSPFVHLDVGSVRHWPRMSRQELVALFPNGNTLHVPSNGKPLPGYEQALAAYKSRRRDGDMIQVAGASRKRGRGLLAAIFGGGADEEEDNAEAQVQVAAARPQPAQQAQAPSRKEPETPATLLAALPADALPVPASAPRPDAIGQVLAEAETVPVSAPANASAANEEAPEEAVSDVLVAALDVPVPRRRPEYEPAESPVQETDDQSGDGEIAPTMAAYARPTPRPEQQPASDVIAELLTTQKDDIPEAQVASAAPTAVAQPADGGLLGDAVASLSDLPAIQNASSVKQEEKAIASQEVAFLKKGDAAAPAVTLSKGARTTKKARRPGPGDVARQPEPRVVPVRTLVADLVLSRESMLNRTGQVDRAVYNARLSEAPKAVYTDGFKRDAATADARRFTGNAVTFLSVAKFQGE